MRLLTALLFAASLCAAPLKRDVEAAIAASPAARRAFVGLHAVDLDTGRTLLDSNSGKLFVPASNTKLFSTALALARLGGQHRFHTRVLASVPPDAAGRVAGDLVLYGGGDPTLSARAIPYRKGPATGNPLAALEELADQVIASGIREVSGEIIGDDTAYIWTPNARGWAQDDAVWEYGAPASALTINDNALTLTIRPGARTGEPVTMSVWPALEFYTMECRVRTGGERRIEIDRAPGSRQLQVWGTIPAGDPPFGVLAALDEPALYAARAFAQSLTRRGVRLLGGCSARHRYPNQVADLESGPPTAAPGGIEVARRVSPPLIEVLRIINKVSQNLHAELVLREVGRVRRNVGSAEAGLAELQSFLKEAGLEPDEAEFSDASGLSRRTLASPRACTALLRHMYRSGHREAWLSLMPVGGEDGTLSARFGGADGARRIRAKTGSLSHVAALSGYADRADGKRLAFSILVNNFGGESEPVRKLIDRLALLLTR